MSTNNENKVAEVISIGANRNANRSTESSSESKQEEADLFLETMRKNAEIQKKLQRERLNANQRVLRSYRIKN